MPIASAGLGDRWLRGDPLDGVAFGPQAAVQVIAGPHQGRRGVVRLLLGIAPQPVYVVTLETGARCKIAQDALQPA
jgi:hypothetical protein